jgi:hypothetical protein
MKPTPRGCRFTERLVWLGFMLFFVIVLAIYIARGIGLEQDRHRGQPRPARGAGAARAIHPRRSARGQPMSA